MVHYLCTADHAYTIRTFLTHWAPELAASCEIVPYPEITARRRWTGGTVVFSDLERIHPEEWPWLRVLERALEADGRFTLLNRPSRYVPRRVFQERLRALGLQDFRTAAASAPPPDLRFPAFLRWEDDHGGPWGGLLQDRAALESAVATARQSDPGRFPRMLVVEHLDCRDADGLVRKYGVVKAGTKLVPRHLQFSAHWVVKRVDVVTDATVAEEEAWMASMPHADAVEQAFATAGLDYGRIDYSFHHGRMQVWEINSNPALVCLREQTDLRRLASQAASARALEAAFRAWDGGGTGPARPLASWMSRAALAWHRRGLAFPARP